MININDFIATADFSKFSDNELEEVIQNFEKNLCLGSLIDNRIIVAADLAKKELERRK